MIKSVFKRLLIGIPVILIGISVFGQSIKIEARNRVEDDAFQKSQSILPVYRYLGDSIEPYTKFGLEIDTTQPWYKIKKLPDMKNTADTGYTYIYFSGADNPISQGYVLTLIGNFRRSRNDMYFYVDRNNDFDFTNDGPPDTLSFRDESFEITLNNKNVPEATYTIKLTRFKYGENVPYKNMLSKHYKNHSGKKMFTDINFCFREQRYNCISADYLSETDSFTIGIKDMNVNGIYNESCTDLLYVGAYKSQIIADKLYNLTPTLEKNAFEWNGKKYRFEAIESTGKYVIIKEDPNAKLSNKLEIGKKVPNISYFNILNQKHKLSEYKGKQVYLFFWAKETITEEDTMYLNKLNTKFGNQLKLITLNHGDEPKQVRIMYYYDKIAWPVGYSNQDIADDFFLEDLTRGYLISKKRKLIDDRIKPKEVYDLLVNQRK
ncbi:MAG: hypothetical protein RLZZ337_2028 [Bacteroidota bacterium]|jgi:hypothetical protein